MSLHISFRLFGRLLGFTGQHFQLIQYLTSSAGDQNVADALEPLSSPRVGRREAVLAGH